MEKESNISIETPYGRIDFYFNEGLENEEGIKKAILTLKEYLKSQIDCL